MAFERNDGQAASPVAFVARFPRYNVFLTSTGAAISFCSPNDGAVALRLVGADANPAWEAKVKLLGTVSYFIGSDPALWRRRIPTYSEVRCLEVWPGTSVVYRSTAGREMEFDFIVEPGADPSRMQLALDGAQGAELDARGDLLLHVGQARFRLRKPLLFQGGDGNRRAVRGEYRIGRDGHVGFAVAAYDKRLALTIDPVLVYSTLLGASTEDRSFSIAVDDAGHAHMAGATQSLNFPTQVPYQPAHAGSRWDGVVAKLNASGSDLLYSTYLGGNRDDFCRAIAIDTNGNACVAGSTRSNNFPTTAGAFAQDSAGHFDAFVAKLALDGSDLIFSTLIGGSEEDQCRAMALDGSNAIYLTGHTDSPDFPVTDDAVQPNFAGNRDAFITKLEADGSGLVYSTFLGGSDEDVGTSIAVDSEDAIYVTGYTRSADLATANALQPAFGGGQTDGFVAKVAADGSSFVYFTYLGGSGEEASAGCRIAVDGDNAIVATTTNSEDFPVLNARQPALAGVGDVAIVRLAGDGTLVFSTYLGGPLDERAGGLAVDSRGNIVVGGAAAAGFPTVQPIQQDAQGGFDAFVAILSRDGSSLLFSTLLGDIGFDGVTGLVVDSRDSIYITGDAENGGFPTTAGAFQTEPGGDWDPFIAKISGRVYPYEYVALVVTGVQEDPASRRLTPGTYATSVNIHNPNEERVLFFKKLALSYPPAEQRPGGIFPLSTDVLEPDQTLKTDGDEIGARLFPEGLPASVIIGCLVVQSERPLDVTALYTSGTGGARGLPVRHSAIHVEQINERSRLADLSIEKTADILSRVETSDDLFEAEVEYTISVRNNGPFAAEEISIQDVVTAENAEFEVLDIPAPVLVPDGTFTVEAQTATEAEIAIVMGALPAGETATVEFRVRATYSNGMGLVRLIDSATVSHALIDPSTQDNAIEIATQLWP